LAQQVCGKLAAGVRDDLRGAVAMVHRVQDGDHVPAQAPADWC
jgi:hypothetical protein